MSKTYIINLIRHGYTCTSSSSYVRSDRLNRYINSTSYYRFGATGGYSTGYATRGDWPADNGLVTHLKSLDSSQITSISLRATCSGVGYDIGSRWGLAQSANSEGNAQLTNASKSTFSISKNATSITINATSRGIPTYGWVIGGTQSSTSFGTISKMWVVITTTEENVTGEPWVSLFQGFWNSGSVTIGGLSDYGLFDVRMRNTSGTYQGVSILATFCGESNEYFNGTGGTYTETNEASRYYLNCSRDGDQLTFLNCFHVNSAGTVTQMTIAEIIGII